VHAQGPCHAEVDDEEEHELGHEAHKFQVDFRKDFDDRRFFGHDPAEDEAEEDGEGHGDEGHAQGNGEAFQESCDCMGIKQ